MKFFIKFSLLTIWDYAVVFQQFPVARVQKGDDMLIKILIFLHLIIKTNAFFFGIMSGLELMYMPLTCVTRNVSFVMCSNKKLLKIETTGDVGLCIALLSFYLIIMLLHMFFMLSNITEDIFLILLSWLTEETEHQSS